MSVTVRVEWESRHDVEPPEGVTDEEFEARLSSGDDYAWTHALDQVDSRTASPENWEVA